MQSERIIEEMKLVFRDMPFGITHSLKVLHNAEQIMAAEGYPEEKRELVRAVAILHDTGAVEAKRKYGSIDSCYQELEGPGEARKILSKIGYPPADIERIAYIIGAHHSPEKIDGLDFQIQWDADLLENLQSQKFENDGQAKEYIEANFTTVSGKALAYRRIFPGATPSPAQDLN